MHRGNLEELVKTILAMPPPKKQDKKFISQPKTEEPIKPTIKPVIVDNKDEDKVDFVNVKDLIKGMERQNKETAVTPTKPERETNGFPHKKIIDNGHESYAEKVEKFKCEEANNVKEDNEEETQSNEADKALEKSESVDSYTADSSLSRSNSVVNGTPLQPPKPLPRSSISEPGSGEETPGEVPKPKPRTTPVSVTGYKVGLFTLLCGEFINIFFIFFFC